VALDRSFKSFKKSVELDEKGKFEDENVQGIDAVRQVYFNLSGYYFDNEQYPEAYDAVTKYLEGNSIIKEIVGEDAIPTDTASLFRKGYYAQLNDNLEEAKEIYAELVDMRFENKYLYDFYSNILRQEEKTEKALEVIRTGQEVFPSSADLIISELNVYLATGQGEKAIDRFEQAIELDSTNADLHFALGTVYDNLYDRVKDSLPDKANTYKSEALNSYKKAVAIDENYFKAVYNIGVLYFNEGVELSKEMNNLPMSEQEKYEKLKGERNKVFKEALPHLEKAHQLEPEDLPTMKALKEVYFRLGEMEQYKKLNEAIKTKMGETPPKQDGE
jgi:tetratricopeptide (TPR) repeat protein